MTVEVEPPRVKVGVKYVRNMGNFESLHLEVGIEDSVRMGENVQIAFDRVYSFAEKKLMEKIVEVEKEINGVRGGGG